MRLLLAILLPPVVFFTIWRPFQGVLLSVVMGNRDWLACCGYLGRLCA